MRPLDHRDDIAARPAWSVRRNPRGVVITLLPNCRPDRVINGSYDRWERAMRAKMTPAAFDRQYGLNWSTPVGEAFYAEALEHLHEHAPGEFSGWYVREPTGFMPVPASMSTDSVSVGEVRRTPLRVRQTAEARAKRGSVLGADQVALRNRQGIANADRLRGHEGSPPQQVA